MSSMIVHTRLVFRVPDSASVPELLGPVFNGLAHEVNIENDGGPLSLESCEVLGVVPEDGTQPVHFFDAKNADRSLLSRITSEPGTVFVIRIIVEGCESPEERFDFMDRVIEYMEGSADGEHLNTFFFFDTGWESDWLERSMELIFNPANPEIPRRARRDGVSYSQWISRSERDRMVVEYRERRGHGKIHTQEDS